MAAKKKAPVVKAYKYTVGDEDGGWIGETPGEMHEVISSAEEIVRDDPGCVQVIYRLVPVKRVSCPPVLVEDV